MDNQQVTPLELGWLAGILDGEGYIGLRIDEQEKKVVPHIRPEIHVCNTDEEIVLRAYDIMKRLGATGYIRASKAAKSNIKDNYRVTVRRLAQSSIILRAVAPYMTGSKKERAELILKFCDLRTENPGVRNPNIGNGKRGAGRIKPYTEEEMAIFNIAGPMSRRGSSEATREMQRRNSEIWAIMEERKNAS